MIKVNSFAVGIVLTIWSEYASEYSESREVLTQPQVEQLIEELQIKLAEHQYLRDQELKKDQISCPVCNGTGRRNRSKSNCSYCSGLGKISKIGRK